MGAASFRAKDLPGENNAEIDPHEFGHVANVVSDFPPGDFIVGAGDEAAAAKPNQTRDLNEPNPQWNSPEVIL